MLARDLGDHARAVGLARFVGERKVERTLCDGRVFGDGEHPVHLVAHERRLLVLRHRVQLVPRGGIGMRGDDAEDRATQRRGHRVRIGFGGCEATTRFGDDLFVAQLRERADQRGAQDRDRVGFARLRFPTHARHHRLQRLDRELAVVRLALRIARVIAIERCEAVGDVAPDLRIGIGRHAHREVEVIRRGLQAGHAERPHVVHHAELVDRRELREAVAQLRELLRRVQRAVVTALPRVDDDRAATGHFQRARAALHQRARRLAADALRDHRHAPRERLLVRTILRELALLELQRGLAGLARRRFHADQRDARLQREVVRDVDDRHARRRSAPRSRDRRTSCCRTRASSCTRERRRAMHRRRRSLRACR